jgi:radical SAM additional 4Fe4S-binding domain
MTKPHFIPFDDTHWIAFFTDTCRFFKTNQNGKTLIEEISSGMGFDEAIENFDLTRDQYMDYVKKIESYSEPGTGQEKAEGACKHKGNHLDRLVIHVSNDCNLRCQYCYAAGGAYGSARRLMSLDMLQTVLNVFFQHFDSITNVQIFGGEPLMNMPAVRAICEYVRARNEEAEHKTSIGLVTNATLIDAEFIELVKDYEVNVTISYDGDVKTNNELRVYQDRRGSSEDVLKKAKELYDATGQPDTIEVTYTQLHVNNHVGILEIVRNIKEMLPNTNVHLVPVSGCDGKPVGLKTLEMFPASVDELFAEKEFTKTPTYSLVERIFAGMANRNPNNRFICNAGVGTLSVSVEGDVYPCFMFTNEQALCLGNIADKDLFESNRFIEGLGKLRQFNDKSMNETCRGCFIRTLCYGCLGMNATHEGDCFRINEKVCDMFRDMMTRAIIQYTEHGLMVEERNEAQQT